MEVLRMQMMRMIYNTNKVSTVQLTKD